MRKSRDGECLIVAGFTVGLPQAIEIEKQLNIVPPEIRQFLEQSPIEMYQLSECESDHIRKRKSVFALHGPQKPCISFQISPSTRNFLQTFSSTNRVKQ